MEHGTKSNNSQIVPKIGLFGVPLRTPPHSGVSILTCHELPGKAAFLGHHQKQWMLALAGWLRRLEHHPVHQRVIGFLVRAHT